MRQAVLKQNKSWAPITLLVGQIIAQVSAILSLFFFDWTLPTILTSIFVYCSIMLGITMGYHRLYSHKAFKCPKWIEYYLLFFAHIMMVGPAITWVANHREHHKYAEKVLEKIESKGFRATIDVADEPLGKRVREGKVEKIPHLLVVGDEDKQNETVADNTRGGSEPERDLPLKEVLLRLTEEVGNRV